MLGKKPSRPWKTRVRLCLPSEAFGEAGCFFCSKPLMERKMKFLEFGLVPEGRAGMMSAFENE